MKHDPGLREALIKELFELDRQNYYLRQYLKTKELNNNPFKDGIEGKDTEEIKQQIKLNLILIKFAAATLEGTEWRDK